MPIAIVIRNLVYLIDYSAQIFSLIHVVFTVNKNFALQSFPDFDRVQLLLELNRLEN